MKIWLDDVRPARNVFVRVHSVNEAILLIEMMENNGEQIELIDSDHNLSDYYRDGCDGIKLLD